MGELPQALRRPLFLLGMMGAGKSRVGRELAELTGAVFVDLDTRVERMFASSIPELFELGEDYFRACERAALRSLVAEPGFARSAAVVATGGGVVTRVENLRTMAEVGDRIYLDVRVDTLVARLSDAAEQSQRPLLACERSVAEQGSARAGLAQRLQDLLSTREPAYRGAGLTLSGEQQPELVAREILRLLASDGLPSGHAPR